MPYREANLTQPKMESRMLFLLRKYSPFVYLPLLRILKVLLFVPCALCCFAIAFLLMIFIDPLKYIFTGKYGLKTPKSYDDNWRSPIWFYFIDEMVVNWFTVAWKWGEK